MSLRLLLRMINKTKKMGIKEKKISLFFGFIVFLSTIIYLSQFDYGYGCEYVGMVKDIDIKNNFMGSDTIIKTDVSTYSEHKQWEDYYLNQEIYLCENRVGNILTHNPQEYVER